MDDGTAKFRRQIAEIPQITVQVDFACIGRLERFAKKAREEMGPERWAELNREWADA